jgi:4-amino-4-deoxy-L-arabinose transferase-like glycosyltransferase
VLFAAAAWLRFIHLDYGLRHSPDYDESIFVENVLGMIARGDWDHRFYEYPGLLLWILRLVLAATGALGAEAYLVCRAVIALSSAVTVPLVFAATSSWVSRRAGWFAAAMVALSPIDIETAQMLRPDAMIAPVLFAALALAAPRQGAGHTRSAWAVAAVGTAIKFSGALVFAPLLLAAHGARRTWSEIATLSAMALLVFAALSPYTFLGAGESLAAMGVQLDYHYGASSGAGVWPALRGFLSETLMRALSLPGLALAAWGVALGLRLRSRFALCWILFPTLWILVFSTSGVRYGRFVVPVLGACCVLAALGLEDIWTRTRVIAIAAATSALIASGLATSRYISAISSPLTLDQALNWLGDHPDIQAVGSSISGLGAFESAGPEITTLRGFRGDAFVAAQFEALVLLGETSAPAGFALAARFAPESMYNGPELAVFRALAPRRLIPLDLRAALVRSSAPGRDAQLTDGLVSTRWRCDATKAFIELSWPNAVVPTRLDLSFGGMPPNRELRVAVSDDLGSLEVESLRPPFDRQRRTAEGFSQAMAWPERSTRTLRIDLAGPAPLRIGEIRVFTIANYDRPILERETQ